LVRAGRFAHPIGAKRLALQPAFWADGTTIFAEKGDKTMKFCAASDSHGDFDVLCRMLEKERPDGMIFLGDGVREALRAGRLFGLPVLAVAGNCDLACQEPATLQPSPEGFPLFLTHGHRFGVKQGFGELERAAEQAGAKAAFFGHTHQPMLREGGPVALYNPGSVGQRGTYLTVEIGGGKLTCRLERAE
jgi:putative phosphoesterase